jgi:[protein-PII] uridylyltransferase
MDAVARLRDEEASIVHRLEEGVSGLLVSRELARAMDAFLVAHFAATRQVTPCKGALSLVAVGGQGRGERSPKSDVDIVFLHDGRDIIGLTALCNAFFYPLWDHKLDVGQAVRTVAETVSLFSRDEAALTAHLDARLLAGDAALFQSLVAESSRAFEKQGAAYVKKRLEPIKDRARAETLVFVLEPNLKNGAGGLRDIHEISWIQRFKRSSLLSSAEERRLLAAKSFFLRARAHLHLLAGRRQDQVLFEYQRPLSECIYSHGSPRDGVEQLLGRHYKHAQAVIDIKHRVFLRLAQGQKKQRKPEVRADGFLLVDERLGLASEDHLEKNPRDALRIFDVALREGLLLTDDTLDALSHAAPTLGDEARRDPEMAELFWRIIDHPRGADALVDLHQAGVLERYLPEFGRTRGMVQADFYHAHTVDVHSLNVMSLLYGLRRGEGPEEFTRLAMVEPSFRSLAMGALFHDVGKRSGRDHAVYGAELVSQVMQRLHAPLHDIVDTEKLVVEHLTMPKISQRRDLSDPSLIAAFADKVGTAQALRRLYVLSYVDTHGTGPTLWTPWKGALLKELYERTLAHFGEAEAVRPTISPETSSHFQPLIACGGGAEVGEESHGHHALYVVWKDRPGLLALVAGICAEQRLSIASAELVSSEAGWACDRFMLRYDSPRGLTEAEAIFERKQRLARVSGALISALASDAKATVSPRARAQHPLYAPEVRVTLGGESTQGQIVDIIAADRPGLLFDLASAVTACGYSIAFARIHTEGARAVDAFYVRPHGGAVPLNVLKSKLEQAAQ